MSFNENNNCIMAKTSNLKSISERRLSDFQHVHLLNGYKFPKERGEFYKYMPLDRFIASINKGKFIFVSPSLWKDPFEKLYFNVDCSSHRYNTEQIACLCVTEKSATNEDASWKAYTDNGEKAVRLSINRHLFLEQLDDYASKNGYEVYVGRAQYWLEKKDIMNLHKPGAPYHDLFFPDPMERMHYLSVMLLKRSAFNYENEVRIFLVKQGEIPFENNLLRIPCDYKWDGLITDVTLSPYPVLPDSDDLLHSVRARMNNLESAELKRILRDLVDCPIRQSMLYNTYKSVKKIV